jgi:hypothetical protein
VDIPGAWLMLNLALMWITGAYNIVANHRRARSVA